MESVLKIVASGVPGELESTTFLAYSKQETKHIFKFLSKLMGMWQEL